MVTERDKNDKALSMSNFSDAGKKWRIHLRRSISGPSLNLSSDANDFADASLTSKVCQAPKLFQTQYCPHTDGIFLGYAGKC